MHIDNEISLSKAQTHAGQLFESQYVSDFTGQEMLDHLTPYPCACTWSCLLCNTREPASHFISLRADWICDGRAFSPRLVSDGAAISLTPTDRYDNVHWLYCQVTEGQNNTHHVFTASFAQSLPVL